MNQYRLFPQPDNRERDKYSSKPLPGIPAEFYLIPQPSASYESLLDHSVPSPSLIESDELNKLWCRVSQHSASYLDAAPELSHSDTDSECFDTLLTPDYRYRRETLLPPAPHISFADQDPIRANTSLSFTSTQVNTPPPSPVEYSKRSATPIQLEQLSCNLDDLCVADRNHCSQRARPKTPISILTTSQSLATLCEEPSITDPDMDLSKLSGRKGKPTNIALSAGPRNISPPLPSPVNNNGLFGPPLAASGATESSYQQCRPAPCTPDETQEVSCMDWDDGESTSRLTRMKKSFTDLKKAGQHPKTSSASPPSRPPLQQLPSSHQSNDTTSSPPQATTPQRQIHTIPAARLSKKPSLKAPRKRGWSQNSTFSEKSTKVGTPLTTDTRTPTALRRAESPHLISPKKRRFSTASRRGRGAKMGASRFRKFMSRLFGC